MNEPILLQNILALVTDFGASARSGVDMLIERGKVQAVGSNLVKPGFEGRVIDCSESVVIPGMVNTHHHFYQTLTRNLPSVQNAKLFDWLVYLYEIWKHLDADAVYYSSLLAIGELLKTGCTATTDHHYLYPNKFAGDIMELQFAAADRLGIRFSPTRGSMSLSKKDGGLPPDSVVQTEAEIIRNSQLVIEKYHDPRPDAMHKIILAPCSPFSVSKELMRESARLARSNGVRLHTHLAETIDENDYCLSIHGKRPLALMEECEFIGSDVSYAHGIHFNDDELRLLAETGTQIAHCPSSNMRLGSGICRVAEMKELGITVGLAVDGSASNDSSDMLGEARNALLLQRVKYGSEAATVQDVFTLATGNGAAMLGFDACGTLDIGKEADMAIFDVSRFEYAGSHSDPVASLLFTGFNHGTRFTIVQGRIAVDEGVLVGVDEQELSRAGRGVERALMQAADRL